MNHHAAHGADHASPQLQQPLAQGPDLGASAPRPRCASPQLLHQHPQLVRPETGATGAVDLQALVQFLDAVFKVAALAVHLLVNPLRGSHLSCRGLGPLLAAEGGLRARGLKAYLAPIGLAGGCPVSGQNVR